ncbi:MAG: hypothetical protein Q8P67_13790 [archaeon]|nr:hypothetical protein [archaeon]
MATGLEMLAFDILPFSSQRNTLFLWGLGEKNNQKKCLTALLGLAFFAVFEISYDVHAAPHSCDT